MCRYGKEPSGFGEKGESVATAFFLFADECDGRIWRRALDERTRAVGCPPQRNRQTRSRASHRHDFWSTTPSCYNTDGGTLLQVYLEYDSELIVKLLG